MRQLSCFLKLPAASELSPAQLQRVLDLQKSYPIELRELTASQKQERFQLAFEQRRHPDTGDQADIFAAIGGNRSGKSYVAGWLCFAKHLRYRSRDGDLYWCVGQTLDRSIGGQQKEVWEALPRWMFNDQMWTEKGGFASGKHAKIVLPSSDGGRCLIEFRSADQALSTFEQAKLSGVWIDERISEAVYDRLLARIIDKDAWILISDIPEQWWQFSRLMEAKPDAGVYYQLFEMSDNQRNLPAGAIQKAAAKMTEDEARMRIKGLPAVMEGIVYRKFVDLLKPKGHLVKRFRIPGNGIPPFNASNWPRWRFIDYGASAPTACAWFAIAPNEHAYIYREHYKRNLSVWENARMIIEASGPEQYVNTYIDPHAYDKPPVTYGASESIADQYTGAGIITIPWPFVQVMGEKAMVERVKYRFENYTLWVFEDLVNCRRELRSWKHKLDKITGKTLAADAYEDDNNHLLDDLKAFFAINPIFTHGALTVTGGGES